ncbi:MAG: hypothetical protein FJ213_06300 [Ignavibacteria bacterium]|nr:hypothetical protein [Ignavibacteria bacterium]
MIGIFNHFIESKFSRIELISRFLPNFHYKFKHCGFTLQERLSAATAIHILKRVRNKIKYLIEIDEEYANWNSVTLEIY